ncbi:MAG: hypothetical protein HY057_01210 [Rhodospirillales bacterium]|nr:hypothetical protein [Rhodospirillales bacterium]
MGEPNPVQPPAAAAASEPPTAPPSAGRVDRSTHFVFDHKVFNVDGAFFSLSKIEEPLFHVPLGDMKAALPLGTLRREFDLPENGADEKLLAIVEKGLRHVKEIRPNDSIPRELLDGSCSWTLEEKHREIARNRLSVQLALWLTGEESVVDDIARLQQLAGDPKIKQKVNEALSEMAERLGYGRNRKEEVVKKIEDLGRELAYVEALRDRYGMIRRIGEKVEQLNKLYRRDRGMVEEITRVQNLFRKPKNEFETMFNQVDGQTGELLIVVKKFAAQVEFIRTIRDDLHFQMMKWDDLIPKWQEQTVERGELAEGLIRATYRFLAQHYLQTSNWQLNRGRAR